MSINLSNELGLSSNNSAISSNENEVSHNPVSAANRSQIRVLYTIKFLNSMSLGLNIVLLSQYPKNINMENTEFKSYVDTLKPSYAIVQAISNIGFGLISDKFGRKPILNIYLLGSGLFTSLFGFNKNATVFSLLYILNGAFNCSGGIINTMAIELCDKHCRTSTLAHLTYLEYIALCSGAILGGCIAIQSLIESEFNSNENPTSTIITLIPCLISTSINAVAYILSRYYLDETMDENRPSLNIVNAKNESCENLDKLSKPEQSALSGLNMSKNSKLILIGSLLAALSQSWFSSIDSDWFGRLETDKYLNFLGENVYISALLNITTVGALTIYPYIIKKVGALNVYRPLLPLTSVTFVLYSKLTHLTKIRFEPIIFISLGFLSSVHIGFSCLYNTSSNLLLAESSEVTKNLGTLYGISSALDNIALLTTKPIFSAIQKISTYNMLPSLLSYNNLNWGLLTTLSLTGYWVSTKIKNF
jgi:MFS family permease